MRARPQPYPYLLLTWAACAAPGTLPMGPYLGQNASETPAPFAPDFISTEHGEMNAAFSPDGAELYFTRKNTGDQPSRIMISRRSEGRWQPAVVATFSGRYRDVDPMFTPDGSRLYFSSYRPREEGAPARNDADIWYVERRGDGWGEAVLVAPPVSTPQDDFHPSVSRDGNLYYSIWDEQRGTGDIFRARPVEGRYEVERVATPINSDSTEYDPFIAADESYLIFASSRPGGLGDSDLYLALREGAGWSEPINLGAEINSAGRDYCPVFSPDGAYFFFTSQRPSRKEPSRVYWLSATATLQPHKARGGP